MFFKYTVLATLFLANGASGSTSPSTSPTTSPTSSPSTSPTTSPTSSPSTSPTTSPSSSPSTSPTASPSTSPTTSPTSSPTTSPTSKPSSQPSESPSSQPSSMPSESPSSQPSSAPSDMPSSMPSESPSSMPSESPSSQPSSMPSESPSSKPSSQPSSMPSCTPSVAPTPQPSINLFYPDWSANGYEQGCLNDGNQQAFMESNPGTYMHSTLDACCSAHFAWNYNGCMGMLDDTCVRALWYPDWEGENTACKRDGNEPLYMIDNPTLYMFTSKSDCCAEHYSWNLAECMGSGSSNSGGKYYPDWLGDDTCKNDGSAPTYMVSNPTMWLHDSLDDCCAKNYGWKLAECKNGGTAPAPAPGSGKYYPDWAGDNEGCRNDGNEPEYMVNNPTQWTYDTLDECCDKHYGYIAAACKGTSSSGSTQFWYNSDKKCVMDCVGSAPCGGLAESWDAKYDTKSECCEGKHWWDTRTCEAA